MELYNKYRPKTVEEILGNDLAIKSIQTEIKNGSHTFLFTGNGGCGKSTTARVFANILGASDISIHEINSADNRGIDTVREIIETMKYRPLDDSKIVYILDECFHKDTFIDTLRGRVKIKDIVPGELIFNSDGVSTVKSIQKKQNQR